MINRQKSDRRRSIDSIRVGAIFCFWDFGPTLRSSSQFFSRSASKVSASKYWRSKIRGWNFGLKLKFYYSSWPLGTRKCHQNLNWWSNKKVLFIKSIYFSKEKKKTLLIKSFCLATNSISDAIFEFPRVDLDNWILISSQNSNLGFLTSSTMRPKL